MSFVLTYTSLISNIQLYAERTEANFVTALPQIVLFAQKRIARELKIAGLRAYATSTFNASTAVIQKPGRWLKTLSINFGTTAVQMAQPATITNGGAGYANPITVTSTGGGFTTQPTWQAFQVNGVITQIVPLTPGASGNGTGVTFTITGANGTGSGATATASSSTANNKRNVLYERSYEYCRAYWPDSTITGTPKFYADYDWNNWLIVPTPVLAAPFEAAYYELAQPIDSNNASNWLTDNAPDLLFYACMVEAEPFLKNPDQAAQWQSMYDRAAAAYQTEDKSRASDRTAQRDA